ncbi:hypothetical protein [Bacillus safensis]|uniref:hypothetical protein n=1 Tax=Bacillus safensis TaxID=561879 RepID=UPI001EE660AF|nr:hypothetical protein [Bacillus safensis]
MGRICPADLNVYDIWTAVNGKNHLMDDVSMSRRSLYALTIHRLTSSIVIGDLSFLSFVVQGAVFLLGVDQFEKLLNARSSRKSVKGAAKST